MAIETKAKTTNKPTKKAAATPPKTAPQEPLEAAPLGEVVLYRLKGSDDPAAFNEGVRPGELRPAIVNRVQNPADAPTRVDLTVLTCGLELGENVPPVFVEGAEHGYRWGQWLYREEVYPPRKKTAAEREVLKGGAFVPIFTDASYRGPDGAVEEPSDEGEE